MTQSTVTTATQTPAPVRTATVMLFKASGKYSTTQSWRAPTCAIGPWDMNQSPDFRRLDGGQVLVLSDADTDSFPGDENWGYPQILTGPMR